jgi:hypothetical protein
MLIDDGSVWIFSLALIALQMTYKPHDNKRPTVFQPLSDLRIFAAGVVDIPAFQNILSGR